MNFKMFRYAVLSLCFAFLLAGHVAFAQTEAKSPAASSMTLKQAWNDLFQLSMKEKKGLTFYVNGQTIPGIVTSIIGDEAVEVKNQTSSRIVIRLQSVDAIAVN